MANGHHFAMPICHYYPAMSESRDQSKFVVRLPEGMRDRIAEAARQNNRSMNSEIVHRLESSFSNVMIDPHESQREITFDPEMLTKQLERLIEAKLSELQISEYIKSGQLDVFGNSFGGTKK